MKVLERIPEDVALAKFIKDRLEYEAKHGLNHNSRSFETRKKFGAAGFWPVYTDDTAIGDFQITPSTDLRVFSKATLKKLGLEYPKGFKHTEDAKFKERKKSERRTPKES